MLRTGRFGADLILNRKYTIPFLFEGNKIEKSEKSNKIVEEDSKNEQCGRITWNRHLSGLRRMTIKKGDSNVVTLYFNDDSTCILKFLNREEFTHGLKLALKKMKEYLRSEFEKKAETWQRNEGQTYLHFAAYLGDVDATKMLIEDNAEVNACDNCKYTALHDAAERGYAGCTLQLLCFGAEIDEKAIKYDKTKLLRPIENRLKLLRDGNRMGTSLMSNEERRFMWNLACVLAIKHPVIAFGTFRRIRSFVTFHGIFMGPGYDLGEESIWRTEVDQ